jgi:hypothetical protein
MGSISPDLCRLEAMICLPATPNETCSLQLCFATHRHRYTEYPNILTAVGDQRTDAVKSTDNAVEGTDNAVKGTNNAVKGTDNAVKGTDNAVKGTDNAVEGTDKCREGLTWWGRAPSQRPASPRR